jgi:hypothetical protein
LAFVFYRIESFEQGPHYISICKMYQNARTVQSSDHVDMLNYLSH